ncbi:MAG: hypothetical protein AAGA31_13505 [Bacteroidota bacterium]
MKAIIDYKGVVPDISEVIEFSLSDTSIYELEIVFLGTVKSGDLNLHVFNAITYTGLFEDAKRAKAEVFFITSDDVFVGKYTLGHKSNLPIKLENGQLLFGQNNARCNEKTRIDISARLPETIFIKCKNEMGDLYRFESPPFNLAPE